MGCIMDMEGYSCQVSVSFTPLQEMSKSVREEVDAIGGHSVQLERLESPVFTKHNDNHSTRSSRVAHKVIVNLAIAALPTALLLTPTPHFALAPPPLPLPRQHPPRLLRVPTVLPFISLSSPTTQRQFCPHGMPDWKHSQYFFRQPVLRQLHPFRLIRLLFPSPTTRGLNALLFRVSSTCFASSRSFWCSCASSPTPAPTRLFMQFTQLQPLQNWSDAKHSQYSFRHRDFLQLHDRCYASPRRVITTVGTA